MFKIIGWIRLKFLHKKFRKSVIKLVEKTLINCPINEEKIKRIIEISGKLSLYGIRVDKVLVSELVRQYRFISAQYVPEELILKRYVDKNVFKLPDNRIQAICIGSGKKQHNRECFDLQLCIDEAIGECSVCGKVFYCTIKRR